MNKLIVHCDGGLANRLNCLANGLVIAHFFQIEFEVSWPLNRYCRASISDLFDLDIRSVNRSKYEYADLAEPGLIASDNFLSVNSYCFVDPGVHVTRFKFVRNVSNLILHCNRVILFYPLLLPQFYLNGLPKAGWDTKKLKEKEKER